MTFRVFNGYLALTLLFGQEVPQLTHPEDERGGDDDDDPVNELEPCHVEELL